MELSPSQSWTAHQCLRAPSWSGFRENGEHLSTSSPNEGRRQGETTTSLPFYLSPGKRHSCTESLLPNLALPPAFSLRKEDTSPQTQTGTDGHFVMQMRAPAQRTKLQPRGKGAGPFPADKSKKGGALKMTLPLPHPQPARRRKSNRAQGLGSGCLPSNSEAHTSPKEPNRLLEGVYPW